jgi:hypothetical protein
MSKLLDSLLEDVSAQLKSPEVQATIETHIVRPVISSVLHILYPYLLGVMLLWLIMFVCVALILLILVRGSLVGIPLGILGKE